MKIYNPKPIKKIYIPLLENEKKYITSLNNKIFYIKKIKISYNNNFHIFHSLITIIIILILLLISIILKK